MSIFKEPVTFLLGDDHHIVRQGVRLLIEEIFEDAEFYNASTINQILTNFEEHKIDIAILDIQFPDGNLTDYISQLKEIQPHCKIIAFTSFEEEKYAIPVLELGVSGFLEKMSEEETIQNAIKKIYETGRYMSDKTQELLILKKVNPGLISPLSVLSERELQVAKLLTQGLGNLEIANELNLKQNTISTFKKRIFSKLDIQSIVELIELISAYPDI